ncbi:hypothetical protein GCM10018777_56450 [Streptomyces albogriseolus]|uniref:hypothetical protein n=1 Tax=Streptomyces TaxID=1883 RepID=UPI00167B0407|nr:MULTISPECIES: hypothetical protein [Streptomyces]GHB15895.1 hypothetical protein GCM10010330_81270 [Streptomyces tendae]GHG33122.1 hypothetical protein GCM10018777_56450 [Streptomyces viridodiastaticus]
MKKDPTRTASTTPTADGTDAVRDVYEQLAGRAGRKLLTALQALPVFKPAPGRTIGALRITVEIVDGPELGVVDLDSVNVHDLAELTARRAEGLHAKHAAPAAPSARPALRLLGGAR